MDEINNHSNKSNTHNESHHHNGSSNDSDHQNHSKFQNLWNYFRNKSKNSSAPAQSTDTPNSGDLTLTPIAPEKLGAIPKGLPSSGSGKSPRGLDPLTPAPVVPEKLGALPKGPGGAGGPGGNPGGPGGNPRGLDSLTPAPEVPVKLGALPKGPSGPGSPGKNPRGLDENESNTHNESHHHNGSNIHHNESNLSDHHHLNESHHSHNDSHNQSDSNHHERPRRLEETTSEQPAEIIVGITNVTEETQSPFDFDNSANTSFPGPPPPMDGHRKNESQNFNSSFFSDRGPRPPFWNNGRNGSQGFLDRANFSEFCGNLLSHAMITELVEDSILQAKKGEGLLSERVEHPKDPMFSVVIQLLAPELLRIETVF